MTKLLQLKWGVESAPCCSEWIECEDAESETVTVTAHSLGKTFSTEMCVWVSGIKSFYNRWTNAKEGRWLGQGIAAAVSGSTFHKIGTLFLCLWLSARICATSLPRFCATHWDTALEKHTGPSGGENQFGWKFRRWMGKDMASAVSSLLVCVSSGW